MLQDYGYRRQVRIFCTGGISCGMPENNDVGAFKGSASDNPWNCRSKGADLPGARGEGSNRKVYIFVVLWIWIVFSNDYNKDRKDKNLEREVI